jgi:hypothetical protein
MRRKRASDNSWETGNRDLAVRKGSLKLRAEKCLDTSVDLTWSEYGNTGVCCRAVVVVGDDDRGKLRRMINCTPASTATLPR